MAFDRFLIAPINTGWETDLRPWLIPDDAFATLFNAWVFRGRLRKRFGSEYMGTFPGDTAQLASRLGIQIGSTDAMGAITAVVPGIIFEVGQLFAIGSEIFTVTVTGAPGVMLTTGAATTHTFNTTTGQVIITGAAAITPVFFYPAQPVMGLTNYQVGPINNQPSYGFDTQFAYTFDSASGRWIRSQSGGNPVFKGDEEDFFWSCNWRGITPSNKALFVTNFNATIGAPALTDDPMWTFDGTTWSDFSAFTIFVTAGDFVQTARLIVAFKNRLLLLNTIEQDAANTTNTAYPNRVRYSHNGSPFSNNAWLEPKNTNGGSNADGAGFIDAPTEEAIVSAEFIKDRLIVFFERSTWELAYTGNQVLPFVWQKINTELGSEATFSVVPFDKVILAIGNTGVHACNGSNVERIDNKIPDTVFEIFNKEDGVSRVAGIRDYFSEMVYWSFPLDNSAINQPFPDRVLVYNYKNNSWALNDDTITCFGYFEQQQSLTLAAWDTELEESHWELQGGNVQSQFRQVIAGNQEGFVTVIDTDISKNAATRQISRVVGSVLTIINHMFVPGNYIALYDLNGIPIDDDENIYSIATAAFTVDTITVFPALPAGVYLGGGTAALVSNFVIESKQWNPYVGQDRNFYLAKIDFGVQSTENGEVTVAYSTNDTTMDLVQNGIQTGAIMGNGILETHAYATVPYEEHQKRLWHPIYMQADGQCVQILIYMSDDQMREPDIAFSDFQIDGMALYTTPTSSRLQ